MTWDNAVWISPKSAERYKLSTGDIVELALDGRAIKGPVLIMPGQADESISIHFGYGRTHAGRVANGIGFNAHALRPSRALWQADGIAIARRGSGYEFATTQITQTMEGREPFRAATPRQSTYTCSLRSEEQVVPADINPRFPCGPIPITSGAWRST